MNIETFKTITLTFLVGLSLVLTYSLWSFQPNITYFSTDQEEYVNEVDIGGSTEKKKTLIQPLQIIFHKEGKPFGFKNPLELEGFYQNMQEWTLEPTTVTQHVDEQSNQNWVEIIFPDSLPLEIAKNLFQMNEVDDLPMWSFDKIIITLNDLNSTLFFNFISTSSTQQQTFVVKDASIYNHLRGYFLYRTDLQELLVFNEEKEPIYLMKDSVEMKTHSLTIQMIHSNLLVNALFSNPSDVSANIREAYFTDGQRGLRILSDNRGMEFINPIHSNGEQMNPLSLLDRSISKINEHKGWTNQFYLESMNPANNQLIYRMYYEGYPVFGITRDLDLTVIEQRFLNQELHLYRRPLFKIENLLGGDWVQLPSGKNVVQYLMANDIYDPSMIHDIRLGYKLTDYAGTSYSITLVPTWYIQYKGDWLEIRLEEFEQFRRK